MLHRNAFHHEGTKYCTGDKKCTALPALLATPMWGSYANSDIFRHWRSKRFLGCVSILLPAQYESNDRCNQENLIGQLKSGMNALRMPLDNLNSNGMYLVTACLAWTLKSWAALSLVVDGRKRAEKHRRERLMNMEFATFLQAMIMIPAQVIRSGRQTVVRFLNVNDWTATFFQLVEQLRTARCVRRE